MRAVWSFWSKPFAEARGSGWHRPLHHLLAWGLSLRLARRHYPDTMLVTDSEGRALLVDGLGLSFETVTTDLDRLRRADGRLWALGKLAAYGLQTAPFVHLDTDVFLWRALPGRVTSAPVLAQHLERWPAGDGACCPHLLEDAFARAGLRLPAEWAWARARWGVTVLEANCGIVGGTHVAFLRHYAGLALDLVLNEPALRVRMGRRRRARSAHHDARAVPALGLRGLPPLALGLALPRRPSPIPIPIAAHGVRSAVRSATGLHTPSRGRQARPARGSAA